MDFSELILCRQSVRSYEDREVESWKIDTLIEAVRNAPSASNSQPWKLIIVNDHQKKQAVAQLTYSRLVSFNRFAIQAPVIAVMTIEKAGIVTQIGAKLKDREFSLIDIGIAASHFCLQAAELGLGTCMLGWFDEDAIKAQLNIPAKVRVGLVITLGYGSDDKRAKIRKTKEQMSSFNSYK